ncbi:MAG: molybdopterin guanine dinucleotide-containing S/N-oxide reductase [Campylobacter sp.]|nr:molybdopterin guanine dinucleotide-containing S/N-oxide reductase [Campylobacter sp.]
MMKRRSFLKVSAAIGGASLVPSFVFAENAPKKDLVTNGRILTAAHWGILDVEVKDGKVISSNSALKISPIDNPLQRYTKDLVENSRVKHAYVRKSYLENPDSPKPELRGTEEFVKVKYEDAIKLVANELKKTRKAKGNQSVFAGSYGWKSTGNVHNSRILLHRFMNLSGGFVGSLGDYSTGASQIIMPHVTGSIEVYEQQTSWGVILENTEVVVLWGVNPYSTLKIAWTANEEMCNKYLNDLKNSGKEIYIIDPRLSETGKFFGDKAKWIAPIPNTDVAMMLAMMHHLLTTENYDKDFLENYTVGFDKMSEYLLGKEDGVVKDAKWASAICGIDEKTITNLAEVCKNKRSFFMSGWGMQRAHHGEQPHWALVTLASMIGQIGLPGGGFSLGHHYSGAGVATAKGGVIGGVSSGGVGNFDENGKFLGLLSTGAKNNGTGQSWLIKATKYAFPVARIADALLNPGKKIDHNGSTITYPDIDFIYWVGGNPFVHHQDTNRLVKAFREPRTVVVNEPYWTPTAKMADIVLPTTTQYERNDITMVGDYSNTYIAPMKQVVAKQNDARDDYQIFSDLCKAYADGMVEVYTDGGKDEFDWIEQFYEGARKQVLANPDLGIEMKPFKEWWDENKVVEFSPTMESMEYVKFADFIEDPILNALGTPSGLIEIYSETIAKMNYDDCKAHPTWFEPIEWLGMKDKPAKFALISPHPDGRLHSQLSQTSLRDTYAVNNREPLHIHPDDAKEIGIKDGDIIRVFNARGQILAGVVIDSGIRKGVVALSEGAWYDPLNPLEANTICKNGSANVLTIDIPTSKLANGNISHTALVNIEKFSGEIPSLSAFEVPFGA